MVLPYLLTLPTHGAPDHGWLSVAEPPDLPFAVRRSYWTYGVPTGHGRGRHGHRTLEQLLVAVSGELRVTLEGPTFARHTFLLTHPDQALYVPPGHWHEVVFGTKAVLLALASHEYDEADYVR